MVEAIGNAEGGEDSQRRGVGSGMCLERPTNVNHRGTESQSLTGKIFLSVNEPLWFASSEA